MAGLRLVFLSISARAFCFSLASSPAVSLNGNGTCMFAMIRFRTARFSWSVPWTGVFFTGGVCSAGAVVALEPASAFLGTDSAAMLGGVPLAGAPELGGWDSVVGAVAV